MTTSDDTQGLLASLEAIPVFPLAGVVLFPGALLPLHVFEPRYRALLADCLAGHQHMAMAFVRTDGEAPDMAGSPPIERVAGVGLIAQHTALPDGRSNIVLRGRARVVLDELPGAGPYRRARARLIEEVRPNVPAVDRAGLVAAATAFAAASRRADRKTDFSLPAGIGPGAAADLCAHQLIGDASVRQRVLEEVDVVARVRLVTAALAEEIVRARPEARGRPD